MPLAPDDLARLPAMTPYNEVIERQRLEDLRNFRKYLVDSGAVGCLVELYKHTAQKELRMDNPKVLQEFLATFKDPSPDAVEARALHRENETLRDYNSVLQGQIAEMELEVETQRRKNVGCKLWRKIAAEEYWQQQGVSPAEGLTLGQVFERFCGRTAEPNGVVLVNLLRPLQDASAEVLVSRDDFVAWVASALPVELIVNCEAGLIPLLAAAPANVAPLEPTLLETIRSVAPDENAYPAVVDLVPLDENLRALLEAAEAHFAASPFP
eukprot:TRINITY_DN55483_c0_g1_i1.p1 TRINITY_DN55483_c0_g1~~TRINITY_DN55483_c0_g1_i1.p1  ORF type:complete len:268 (-),score=83.15 TRINITY_DN55483_c0_g1_i1:112-915(-)